MADQNILIDTVQGVSIVTINRPSKLNALNKATIQELHDVLSECDEDPEIKVIILTGSGDKAFVAGADISEFAHFSVEQGAELAAKGQEIYFV